MIHKQINFQVRINDNASLSEIGSRVGKVLDCNFTQSEAEEFEGDEALETRVLGIWITLNFYPNLPEGEIRNYRLVGDVPEDIEMPWNDEIINISEYILGILTRQDKPGWYIPQMKELLNEAGIDL
jgi:hypothetical protein